MSVILHTSLGDIKVELRPDLVPKTCFNFLALCAGNSYDNTLFHRVVKGYLIQGGDTETSTGRSGKAVHPCLPEFHADLKHDAIGTVGMCTTREIPSTSQFYITLGSQPELDDNFTVIGYVISGTDVLNKIAAVDVDSNHRPLEKVMLRKTTIRSNPFATEQVTVPKF
ncbi:hypothetical protein P9112_007341 [Eukaryota sp. TZLM1-RC]